MTEQADLKVKIRRLQSKMAEQIDLKVKIRVEVTKQDVRTYATNWKNLSRRKPLKRHECGAFWWKPKDKSERF